MTEADRAAHHRSNKDDEGAWEEVEPVEAAEQKGLATTITVRFSAEDAELIRALAVKLDASYSDVIRRAVRNLLRPRFSFDQQHTTAFVCIGSGLTSTQRGPTFARDVIEVPSITGGHIPNC